MKSVVFSLTVRAFEVDDSLPCKSGMLREMATGESLPGKVFSEVFTPHNVQDVRGLSEEEVRIIVHEGAELLVPTMMREWFSVGRSEDK